MTCRRRGPARRSGARRGAGVIEGGRKLLAARGTARRRLGAKGAVLAFSVFVLACTLAWGAGGQTAEAFADFQLTAYTAAERGSPAVEAMLRFVQLVEDRTAGRVQFDFFHGGALGTDVETLEDLRLRALDVQLAPISAYASLYPAIQTLQTPFLFRDQQHVLETIRGAVGQDILKPLEALGIKGLALWDAGFQHLGTVGRPVGSPDDLEGLRVAVEPEAGAAAAVWEVLGAEPVVVPAREVAARLRAGELDGSGSIPYVFRRSGLEEAERHYSLTAHAWNGYVLAMNYQRWRALPVGIQQMIQEAARDVGLWASQRWARANEEALAAMEKAGVHVERTPDTEEFRRRLAEVYPTLQGQPGYDPALVERIRALGARDDEDNGG